MNILPNDFDINNYRLLNSDLINLNDDELINHYLTNGINEERRYKYILPEDFDVNSYRILNNDIKYLSNEELINHYLKYGLYENRQYKHSLPEDFDINDYRFLNNDLKHFNDEELINHYLKYGIFENRQYKYDLPEDFDVNSYKILNNDIKDFNNEELINHYLNYGIFENRQYKYDLPEDFDINIYRNLNSDLKDLNNEELIKHYLYYGINEYRIYNKTYIYQILNGGLGNQLFMLFNIISLSKEYNKDLFIDFDKNYIKNYLNEQKTIRKSSYDYNLFNKNIFRDISMNELTNCEKYNEPQYIYQEIKLDKNKNYLLNGYYQSYKYFWKNKDIIKNYLFIDQNKINKINKIYNNFGKKIISIHVRLGDYINMPKYHPIQPIDYYKKSLSYYNLDNYQIILFSDNIELARDRLSGLNLKMIDANNFFEDDEDQFYMLFLSDVIICSNSSFSLMSCYFNEIFEFKKDSEYILPNKWFGEDGPKYDMDDFVINYKFYVIDIDNIIFEKKFDVITTIHNKDKERYYRFLRYNKKFIQNVKNFYYISYKNFNNDESKYISEDNYPFTKIDIVNYIKDYIHDSRYGWYYQQLLKLYIFEINQNLTDYVLIFDLVFQNDNFYINVYINIFC
jgi:hypothetical protein